MSMEYYIGIDIGSTAAKAVVLGEREERFELPTGWSSLDAVERIKKRLCDMKIPLERARVVSTGYGRQAVDFAARQVTEITCHAAGCAEHFSSCTVIDVGGQDAKAIWVKDGAVADFIMNDKCSAGTGRFIEVMANRLNCTIDELFLLAERGTPLAISSLCTVFAESEIIGHIGAGRERSDIAAGIVASIAEKVAQLAQRITLEQDVVLTGGLSHIESFAAAIGGKLGCRVACLPQGRYAGAYGAALIARRDGIK